MCEIKEPIMRQGLLGTKSFAFFVAGFDAEQLENPSYLYRLKSGSILLLYLMISLRKLQNRRQCITKTVYQSTTRVICQGLIVNEKKQMR